MQPTPKPPHTTTPLYQQRLNILQSKPRGIILKAITQHLQQQGINAYLNMAGGIYIDTQPPHSIHIKNQTTTITTWTHNNNNNHQQTKIPLAHPQLLNKILATCQQPKSSE